MRRPLIALLIGIAFLLVAPAVHSGYPPPPEPENYCPPLTLIAGEPGQGVYVSEGILSWPGAFAVAAEGMYVMNYGVSNEIGSIYFTQLYQESNGIPGLQRADPICVDEGGWEGADSWVW